MASVSDQFQQVFLTYKDVRDANPGWTERMIEDYLSLKRDVELAADTQGADLTVINERLGALEELIPETFYVTSDHSVTSNEIIICDNLSSITITLLPLPDDQQRVTVKRANEAVTIDGNGQLIDGKEEITLSRRYTSLTFVYSSDAGYWSIV